MEKPSLSKQPAAKEEAAEEFKDAGSGEINTVKKMKVVVAIDESEGSLHALVWALDHIFTTTASTGASASVTGGEVTDLAEHPRGRLILVHAQQPFQHFMFPSGPAVYATTSAVDSIRKAEEENSNKVLGRALQICNERKVKADTLITDGDPKEMICQAVEKMHADLVVVGSRGLSKFQRAFLGSVSDYVAHHARCPVLIVKPLK